VRWEDFIESELDKPGRPLNPPPLLLPYDLSRSCCSSHNLFCLAFTLNAVLMRFLDCFFPRGGFFPAGPHLLCFPLRARCSTSVCFGPPPFGLPPLLDAIVRCPRKTKARGEGLFSPAQTQPGVEALPPFCKGHGPLWTTLLSDSSRPQAMFSHLRKCDVSWSGLSVKK